MKIYFYSHHVYQLDHVFQIYKKTGGIFIVKRINRFLRSKIYLRNGNVDPTFYNFLNAPKFIVKDIAKPIGLSGVLISGTNTYINHDPQKCIKIFMGHGTGDKKYGGIIENLKSFDYHFISGPKHIHKLKDIGLNIPEERLIKIGYTKFDDYLNNKIDKEKYLKYLGVKDTSRKNILYAPTWKWGDGTLHRYGKRFCRELDRDFNLIIRPHFFDRKHIIRLKLWAKYNGFNNVYFSNPGNILKNDTMNDFAISDLMISDTSSIIYEYLVTQKPIIIADNNYQKLHNMPADLSILDVAKTYEGDSHSGICQMVNDELDNTHSRDIYNALLNNCFYFNDGKSVNRAVDFIQSL